jgi:environmental stress-induced protein Ves
MATVGSDGPFSAFEGVDRTLSILSGTGISLAIGKSDPVMLGPGSEPFSFPADTTATARLIDGPITDFNVMTRRRDWRHTVRKVHLPTGEALTIGPVAAQTIVFCRNGTFEANDGTDTALLSESATLWIGRGGNPWVLRATKSGMAFVVEIDASSG